MSEGSSGPPDRLTCSHCREVIGVYEPFVVETPSGPVDTSLARGTSVHGAGYPCYHRACYEMRRGELE